MTHKRINGLHWKVVFGLVGMVLLSGTGLVGLVLYYHFDWSVLADASFYQNLANPEVRIVRVSPGMRKEQIAAIIGSQLGWNATKQTQFENNKAAASLDDSEGYYFPKTYMFNIQNDTPQTVATTMFQTFAQEVATIQKPKTKQVINEDTAVKIASIIQRESGGTSDMRLISGIIWNRLFQGMKLQMDATVQYAKGTATNGWWPQVKPSDITNIDSPYNTYKYFSLPPSPIASPSLAALTAAYNPQTTSCLYYLHDKKGVIHCSPTYAGHLKNIAKYYPS